MLMVISPAKSLDETELIDMPSSGVYFAEESQQLIKQLQKLNVVAIGDLMGLSEKLAQLNYNRFQNWQLPLSTANPATKQAIFLFKGDVYQGMSVASLSAIEIDYLQQNLVILSGLYGAIKPLDLILPYRLEMGSNFANSKGKNIYDFWGNKITDWLNLQLKTNEVLINLASNEYFRVINKKQLKAKIITPIFKDYKNGNYKIISFYAKKARGLMASFAACNKIQDSEELKQFDLAGYKLDSKESTPEQWVFKRKHLKMMP
jgi:cytoplasmic iron level regulating protein YaaA (DUF328/UPF0246 family)